MDDTPEFKKVELLYDTLTAFDLALPEDLQVKYDDLPLRSLVVYEALAKELGL